jgi:ankyrin repeat protein
LGKAAEKGHDEIVRMLLRNGANVHAKKDEGSSCSIRTTPVI